MTVYRRGTNCHISAFELSDPPADPVGITRKWMAVATAHVYDPAVRVPALNGAEVFAGETMRIFHGRGSGDTEAQAMIAALQTLLYQLTANGFSANDDVKLW